MPGDSVVQSAQPVEYVEETTFGTDEADAAWSWIGAVTGFSVTQGVEVETVRYLGDDASAVDLQKLQNVKVSEAYEVEITYAPQDNAFYDYFLGAAGSLSSSLTPIQLGEQDKNNAEYRRIKGCVGEELTISIDEDSVAEVTATFVCADANNWSTTDYVGAGSHATENTAEPHSYDDLGNVNYGGAALADSVESLTLTVSNDLTVTKDPDATPASNIAAITPTSRDIELELSLTYDDMSMAQTVRNYTAQNFTYDFPSTTSWTVTDVAFPEFPYEFGPDDLIGDTLTSDPATDLSFA